MKLAVLLLICSSAFAQDFSDYDDLLNEVDLETEEQNTIIKEKPIEEKKENESPFDLETQKKIEKIEMDFMIEQIIYDYNSMLDPSSISCGDSAYRSPLDYVEEKEPVNPAALGAKKVLSTFFQTCDALDAVIQESTPPLRGVTRIKTGRKDIPYKRKIYSNKKYVKSHILLSQLDQDPSYPGEMCLDMTKRPPLYGYGSRKYPNNKGEINLFTKGAGGTRGGAASQIDCSSFVSVALATQGLKVNSRTSKFQSLTTRNFKEELSKSGSCLKHATFKGDDTIHPGDMINVAGKHIVMIDEIGEDPLAIEKFAKKKKCNSISLSDFDFTYIHSGAIKNNYGPSRVHVTTHNGGTMFNNLRIAAIKQCKRIVANKTGEVSSDRLPPNRKFDIIRHNSDSPKCITDKKVKLRNEECVEQCMDERT